MSWGHATRPKDYIKKGDKIKVKVIKIDPEERKINLSLKHFTPDPWTVFESKYQIDDVVNGHVTKLTDFGAFIELEDGIEGLAHISEEANDALERSKVKSNDLLISITGNVGRIAVFPAYQKLRPGK